MHLMVGWQATLLGSLILQSRLKCLSGCITCVGPACWAVLWAILVWSAPERPTLQENTKSKNFTQPECTHTHPIQISSHSTTTPTWRHRVTSLLHDNATTNIWTHEGHHVYRTPSCYVLTRVLLSSGLIESLTFFLLLYISNASSQSGAMK